LTGTGFLRRHESSLLLVGEPQAEVAPWLRAAGYECRAVATPKAALKALADSPAQLILVCGDDAPAGNEPADLPWSVGSACPLARARGRVRPGRARAHGAAAARRSGRGRRAVHRARLELGGVDAPGIRH